jgi:hypothetical protein
VAKGARQIELGPLVASPKAPALSACQYPELRIYCRMCYFAG